MARKVTKNYRFSISSIMACPGCARDARAIVKDWINSDDYDDIYVKDDVRIYATDPDVIHMVIDNPNGTWDDLPHFLSNAEKILDFLIDVIENRDTELPEERLYNYLTSED